MNTGFVHTIIRRSNRNLLILCVAAALLVFALAVINYRYLTNFFLGPLPLNSRDAAAIQSTNVGLRYYVTVRGDDVADTGYQWVSKSSSGSKTVKSSYAALLVADKLLLVKLPGDNIVDGSVKEFTGALVDIPAGQEGDIIHKQEVEEPSVTGRYLPVMLDTDDFRLPGFIALAVGIAIYAACIYGLTVVNRRSSDPTTHPIMRALSRFGPPQEIAAQLDTEMQSVQQKIGKLNITPSWLVKATASSLQAVRLSDVVWMYKTVTQHRTNGIPTGKTYAATIRDRFGTTMQVTGKQDAVDQMLQAVFNCVPWAAGGYSPELNNAWAKDRAGFIAAVDQRRQNFKGSRGR